MPGKKQTLSTEAYERTKVWLSFALALVAATTSFWFYRYRQGAGLEDTKISIQIIDAANKSPIASSRVELELPKTKQLVTTDSDGRATFRIPTRLIGTNATLRAEAVGFKREDKPTILGKDFFVYLSPSEDIPRASELIPYTQVFRTGQRPSGPGSEYSAWYELAADPPRAGYVIDQQNSTFVLVGDRTCTTGWAECVRSQATETSLVWRFRMQGHNENPFGQGIAPSEGILTVAYTPMRR